MAFLSPEFTGTQEFAAALLPWLTEPVYPPVRGALVSILLLKWARPPGLFDALATAFMDLRGSTDGEEFLLQLQAATALGSVAEPRHVSTLLTLAGDSGFGKARGPVVHALGRWRTLRDRVSGTLLGLLDDPDVAGPAALALSKLQVKEAAPGIRALAVAPHLTPQVRRHFQKLAEKLER
ncbi:MAG: hypothetical protein ACTHKX_09690 [Pseudolysinimonas sp.]